MDLQRLQRDWEHLGKVDPMWAILSAGSRKGGRWETFEEEFFDSGVPEIARSVDLARRAQPALGRGAAIDFGCGIGRLTRSLAAHFDHVVGVDVAPSMIERARRTLPVGMSCEFVVNRSDDLAMFPSGSFDLVHSRIVLQHIPRALCRRYISEFIRVLRPNGCAVFQMTSGPLRERGRLRRTVPAQVHEAFADLRTAMRPAGVIRVFCLSPDEIVHIVRTAAGTVHSIHPDDSFPGYQGFTYAATPAT
jgi:SAM-dependent methyltransferase